MESEIEKCWYNGQTEIMSDQIVLDYRRGSIINAFL